MEGRAGNFSYCQSLYRGRELGIFLRLRTYIEGRARNVFESYSVYIQGENYKMMTRTSLCWVLRLQPVFEGKDGFGIFPSPRTFMKRRARNFSKFHGSYMKRMMGEECIRGFPIVAEVSEIFPKMTSSTGGGY